MFCIVLFVNFCDVCYSVLCVIAVPLPPGINPLAVINNIYYTHIIEDLRLHSASHTTLGRTSDQPDADIST